ncbi:hypothetical protein BYT27DRAFT_7205670 [Phlegmacium glaucopus]|nr:hypothetical protein BYT27DRAFT_7205670 [Phlegmacium glaucopus]
MESPLSLYSIPVVWFTAFYPATWKFLTIDKAIGYNNVQPRLNITKVANNKNISPDLAARIQRMEGAHLNGNEAFPLWVAAVLAGNYAGLESRWLNTMSASYVVLRLLFNHVYINHEKPSTSWLRTLVFFAGLSIPMTILVKAAAKVANH